MKYKIPFLVALIVIGLPCVALADTVRIVTKSTVEGQEVTAEKETGFLPSKPEITVVVAGKTCSLNSSRMGSVPMGCNYTIQVNADGTLSGELRAGNSVCTQTPQVAASCS